MGSRISPIIASIYMEHIERTAITTFHTPPSLWLGCVDDRFCILNKDHIKDFHTHLYSICSHVHFTIKKKHNFSFPFLDVLVRRNSRNGSITTHSLLSTTTYRKPTHTNRYLHYTSHHPNIRSSLLPKLYSARLTLTSHITHRSTVNYTGIRSTLRLNGFPTRTTLLNSRQPRSQNTQYNHFTSISYIPRCYIKAHRKKSEEF